MNLVQGVSYQFIDPDTTDIQNVSATTGTSEAEVSCYFAEGTDCKGCFVQVGWTTDSGIEPVHELTVYRYNSLNATGTIRQLMPGRSYHVIAYDIERSGLRSSVGVPLLGGISTMSDGECMCCFFGFSTCH